MNKRSLRMLELLVQSITASTSMGSIKKILAIQMDFFRSLV